MAELRMERFDYCDWSKAHEFSDLINEHDTEVTGENPEQWYSVYLYDSRNRVVGGAAGITAWGLCDISALAVAKEYRGRGWGTGLVEAVEAIARERGCTYVHLHTMNFQGAEFYRKLGYEILAQLSGGDGRYTRFFLKKPLT
jgi:ribosomal protein S18 acetylase RimI-like enzyme